jgi:hypothetical protein
MGPAITITIIGAGLQAAHMLSPRHTLFVLPQLPAARDEAFAARIASWDECLKRVEVDDRGTMRQMQRREIEGRPLDVSDDGADVPADLRRESVELAERWRLRSR